MLKLISGMIIGSWLSFVIMSICGIISWGFWGILGTGILIGITVAILYVVDLVLDYKNMYKNTRDIATKGMGLFTAWNTYKAVKNNGIK